MEPSRAPSSTAQPAGQGPSLASQLLCEADEQPSDLTTTATAAEQEGLTQQQQQQGQDAACSSAIQGSVSGEANVELYSESEHSPEAAVVLADPVEVMSPGRGEYDPERYKPHPLPAITDCLPSNQSQNKGDAQAQPFITQLRPASVDNEPFPGQHESCSTQGSEAHAQSLSAQSQMQLLSVQTQAQPLGHSPKQAALLKLRSLSAKQSQTTRASGTVQMPLLPSDNSPDALSQSLVKSPDAQTPSGCTTAAEPHMPSHAHRLGPSQGDHPVADGQSSTVPHQQASNRESAETEAIEVSTVPLSPRRSSSVAKLRSQSLTKQLQDPRYASVRRLPLVPISSVRSDASQLVGAPASCSTAVSSNAGQEPTLCERQAMPTWTVPSQQLSNADQMAMVGSEKCQVTSTEEEDEGPAYRLQGQHVPLMAESGGASDRAEVRQPSPQSKSTVLELADIGLMERPAAMSASASTLTRSAEPPLLCGTSAADDASAMSHQLHRSGHRSEGASPVKLSISSKTSHRFSDLAHSGSIGPSLRHHADDSGVQENAARRSGSDCAVAVCIRSLGTGATVSLEVQSDPAHDSSAAARAAAVLHVMASAADCPDDTATVASADTAASIQDLGHLNNSRPHSLEAGQAAVSPPDLRWTEDRGQAPDTCTQDQLLPAELPAVGHGSKQEPVDVASSPADGDQRAVSSSPHKQRSQGQGLIGRLEGGLRSLLGRASRQQVRPELPLQSPAHMKCAYATLPLACLERYQQAA